jgi:hypothetical protein
MPSLRLTLATYTELGKLAVVAVRHTGVQQEDGTMLVPIDDQVHARLEAMRLPNESDDDLIQRVIQQATRRPLA